jgi:cyanophycinase
MTAQPLGVVLDYLCRSTATRGQGEWTDGQLLDHFTATGDEAAFEVLVRRHGPLVLSVCRGVLGHAHDAEDAFQATFLVLVKRARAVRRAESLRSWLYGVARRVAIRARTAAAKRTQSERQHPAMTLPDPAAECARQEQCRMLHEEIARLPERYRLPVLLCCLEGKSRPEAARELGWSEGAVKGRLERGRQRLHARLSRRGLALPAALAAVGLARGAVPACVPRTLVAATTRAAARLAAGPTAGGPISTRVTNLIEGELTAMGTTKLRAIVYVLFLLAVAAFSAGWLPRGGGAGKAAATSLAPAKAGHAGRGDDNVLGVVAPRDPRRPGALLLHGGGRFTTAVRDRFLQLAGGKNARIVLVPSAWFGGPAAYRSRQRYDAAMRQRFSSWFRLVTTGRIKSFEVLGTDDPDEADDPAFVRPLAAATGVWFFGGDQERLNYRYVGRFPRRTRFQSALREVVARGGVVGGTSAGMAVLPEIMTLDQRRRWTGGPYRIVAAHGLGLMNGAVVEQHFDGRSGRWERFTGLLGDSARLDALAGRRGAGRRMLGLAVEVGTALVVRGGRLEVFGGGSAHVFIKSPDGRAVTWHTLRPGGKAHLKRAAGGQVAMVAVR